MNYWKESIEEALSEIGISATADQTKELVEWVDGSHENYGMATGHDVASANGRKWDWRNRYESYLEYLYTESPPKLEWDGTQWILCRTNSERACPASRLVLTTEINQ
jgi:hypothetical protein